LEVVNIHIFGLDVDIVNLRTEEYADTRIPTVKFGTPLEDAMRRDLTINTLFYNVNSGKVEDFTEKGLEDLRLMRIRTPIDPRQTFLDDPLRILRAIRFSITLGFTLSKEIVSCVQTHPKIKTALVSKVTPEQMK
jgi:tRNA nucleotidyltransferase (CCA-adding enzyme)